MLSKSNQTSKISICYIIDGLSFGGAQTHLLNVLKYMDYDRYSISLVCVRHAGLRFNMIKDLPVRSYVCNLPNIMNPIQTLLEIWRIRKFLVDGKVKIIQSYMFNPNLMSGLLRLSLPGLRLITTRRDMGYWHKKQHWLAYRFLNYVTHTVIAVSKQVRQIAIEKEHLNPNKIIVISNGLDINKYNPSNVQTATDLISENSFTIGILAVMRPEKRHDIFIDAAKKILVKIPQARFLIAGDGYPDVKESIIQQIKTHNLEENFTLLGRRNDIPEVISSFDVSVLCSISEGMSNTLIESIALGVPVVATDVGGNPEVIQNGKNGFLVPVGDSDAIANHIIELAKNKNQYTKMSENARKIAIENFDITIAIKNLESVYNKLTAL